METTWSGIIGLLAFFSSLKIKKSAIGKWPWAARYKDFYTVVLEDIFKAHNAVQYFRTWIAFGIQDVHVIEKKPINTSVNPYCTRKGASQWTNLHKYYSKEKVAD